MNNTPPTPAPPDTQPPATEPTEPAAPNHLPPWRNRLHEVIFEADTPTGKLFDIVLIVAILISVLLVMLDSVAWINEQFHTPLIIAEWFFTILFTIEYVLRLLTVRKPLKYALSFYGVVDLLAILPTFLSLLIPGSHELLVIRALRLLRVFRVFKLARFLKEAEELQLALYHARGKMIVFLTFITIIVVIMGTTMHFIEGDPERFPNTPYTSIPESIYWAIITMTTVGFGDITPQTALGKAVTAITVLIGYAMIVVPTSIVTADVMQQHLRRVSTQACPDCSREGHAFDAKHCKHCGSKL